MLGLLQAALCLRAPTQRPEGLYWQGHRVHSLIAAASASSISTFEGLDYGQPGPLFEEVAFTLGSSLRTSPSRWSLATR